jgi:predicted ester cyclase
MSFFGQEQPGQEQADALEDIKRIARVWFDEVMNGKDLTAIDRSYAEDYEYHGPHGVGVTGRDGARAVAERLIASMPDRVATVELQIAEGDMVATRWVSRGTPTQPLLGVTPDGRAVEVHGITVSQIVEGLVAQDWEIVEVVKEPT